MKFSQTNISQIQLRDTCMAMTLLMLILYSIFDQPYFFVAAIIFLLLGMTIPKAMKPFAIFWYALAEALGNVVSKIILGVVFLVIVVPVALVRKLMGKDALLLKRFKASKGETCFVTRDYTYSSKDFDKTY